MDKTVSLKLDTCRYLPIPALTVIEKSVNWNNHMSVIWKIEIIQDIVARLLTETYEQGGLLSMRELSLILCYDSSYLYRLRLTYEKRMNIVLHFTVYDQDMGTAISHKTEILRKIFLEKKDPLQVARETNHSPEAVERYCLHFNKVKWCVENGMGKDEIMIVTGMRSHLVDEYIKIIVLRKTYHN